MGQSLCKGFSRWPYIKSRSSLEGKAVTLRISTASVVSENRTSARRGATRPELPAELNSVRITPHQTMPARAPTKSMLIMRQQSFQRSVAESFSSNVTVIEQSSLNSIRID